MEGVNLRSTPGEALDANESPTQWGQVAEIVLGRKVFTPIIFNIYEDTRNLLSGDKYKCLIKITTIAL